MDALRAFNTRANKLICMVMLLMFTVMVVIVFAQVLFRYAIESPLSWSEELARYLFVWVTFLGASVAFYDNTHINVSLFVEKIRDNRMQALVMVLADLCCLSFLLMYVWQGSIVTSRIFSLGQFSPSMEWLPVGLIYLAIPVGSFFMVCNVLVYTIRHVHALVTGQPVDTVQSH